MNQGFIWRIFSSLLFRFDAERVHRLTVRLIRWGIRLGGGPLRIVSGASRDSNPGGAKSTQLMGLNFTSRVGLAAGFDKDCEIVNGLSDLGFGFVEVGTVTPRGQSGNPKPRLFRDPSRQALFNRMGFNSLGAAIVSKRLGLVRQNLPNGFQVGINLGKNRDTPNELAAQDYASVARHFEGLADYLVVNLSSPNTPGLRDLQTQEAIARIVGEVQSVIQTWKSTPPLLLKLSPELSEENLAGLVPYAEKFGVQGWVLTNTLAGTWGEGEKKLSGGWSGKILAQSSSESLVTVRSLSKLPIISVGGINSADEAVSRLKQGADLVQIYTGWIFSGPQLPVEISLKTRGFRL